LHPNLPFSIEFHHLILLLLKYDIRHAERAKVELQRAVIRDRSLDIHFSIPKDGAEAKKHLDDSIFITLTNTDGELTTDDVRQLFSPFGEIKGVRQWAKKIKK